MSKPVRLSTYRRAAGGSRAHFYASRQGAAAGEGTQGGFVSLMVLLPLATFALVFLWNGPPSSFATMWDDAGKGDAEMRHLYTASEAELARERWPTTPAMLDGAQPRFPICGNGARANCVVDGDTFWYRGDKIRISDNQGAFELGLDPSGRDSDRYGRKLRTINRDGESLGGRLVDEGPAEHWKGRRSSWC